MGKEAIEDGPILLDIGERMIIHWVEANVKQ